MSDNALAYRRTNAFRAVLPAHGATSSSPLHAGLDGRVERFIQILEREWAYAHSCLNSTERTRLCHPSCTTTTGVALTPSLETGRRSTAFTTSVGRTSSPFGS